MKRELDAEASHDGLDIMRRKRESQWRSVKDSMPGTLERVLVFDDGLICIGVLYQDGWYEDSTVEQELSKINPTHWMPLPDPPGSAAWKDACGLKCGGDPDDVTPKAAAEYWAHTNEDGDLPRIEAWPEHRTKPHFTVQMRKPYGQEMASADVVMTHSEPDIDDLEYCIAEFSISFRDDLETCSGCGGKMRHYGIAGAVDCSWCDGQGVSVMDEAMKMAIWIYNSWLTARASPKRMAMAKCEPGDTELPRETPVITFFIYKGDVLLREESLAQDIIKIGKLESSHLRIDDENVSKMHAVIETAGPGEIRIIDFCGSSGTIVNGQRVDKCALQDGDELQFGQFGDIRIVVKIR